jgi:hypothetical protein
MAVNKCERCGETIIKNSCYCRKCARLIRLIYALPKGCYTISGYDQSLAAPDDVDYFARLRGNRLDRGAVLDFVTQGDFYGLVVTAPNGLVITIADTLIIGTSGGKK